MIWLKRIGFVAAVIFLISTFVNASWLAPNPKGSVKLIAEHGLAQLPAPGVQAREDCAATRIEQPVHRFLENTARGAQRAAQLGTHVIGADLRQTADGEFVLFHDAILDCRTNGTGRVADKTLEELKALDIGYGYTPDGGQTYPFRGKGVGLMPTLAEFLAKLPPRTRVLYRMDDSSPQFAVDLAAALEAAGRDPEKKRDIFYGFDAPVGKMRALYPEAWSWGPAQARQCATEYQLVGWTSYVPESCRNGAMFVPLGGGLAFWGWPNRLTARLEEYGGQAIIAAPREGSSIGGGIDQLEQIGEVPASYNGYLWVADAWTVAPALYPSQDTRTAEEQEAAFAGLERRAAAQ